MVLAVDWITNCLVILRVYPQRHCLFQKYDLPLKNVMLYVVNNSFKLRQAIPGTKPEDLRKQPSDHPQADIGFTRGPSGTWTYRDDQKSASQQWARESGAVKTDDTVARIVQWPEAHSCINMSHKTRYLGTFIAKNHWGKLKLFLWVPNTHQRFSYRNCSKARWCTTDLIFLAH